MAAFLGITERGYQCYEQGEREPPIAKLIALADYFDVSIDYLVGRSDEPGRR
jgi:transcriptional regulator with XRE-family HTH domain